MDTVWCAYSEQFIFGGSGAETLLGRLLHYAAASHFHVALKGFLDLF